MMRAMPGALTITAWGQASYDLRGEDAVILIDPWLSTALEEEAGVTRHAGPALRAEEVAAADLVCITHEHGDHLDPRALAVIAERPKIMPHRDAMRRTLAEALSIAADDVSVKGKTNEGMGFVGRGEGLACVAVATLMRRHS